MPIVVTGGHRRLPSVTTPSADWPFDSAEPWRLEAADSLLDGFPAGATLLDASEFSTSDDFLTVMNAIDAANVPVGSIVGLEANRTLWINRLRDYNTSGVPNWLGYANSNRKILGFLGHGVLGGSRVQASPTMIADTPDSRGYNLRNMILDPAKPWVPVPVGGVFLSNTANSSAPTADQRQAFISGVDWRGTLQGPFGVYSATVQAEKLSARNPSASAPLVWRGMSTSRLTAGSRVQYNRFAGFGTALNSSPPFETGSLDSNFGRELIRRCEFDGRLAADIDPTQPRVVGALMVNKGIDLAVEDTRLHHTRRSGWATNTNTNSQAERYYGRRVRVDNIADGLDNWPSDASTFDGSNVEEVNGVFYYEDVWINAGNTSARGHVHLANPATAGNGQTQTVPDRPIIVWCGPFRTDDTIYGGCRRIRVSKQPNSTGISPTWQKLTDLGIAGSNLFDVTGANGQQLVGVRHSDWNSSMRPDTHYVVIY